MRPNDRERWSSNVVEFGPNTISPGSAPVTSAAARRASAISASVSSLAANAPCVLEMPLRRWPAIASITVCGTCEPPGASA